MGLSGFGGELPQSTAGFGAGIWHPRAMREGGSSLETARAGGSRSCWQYPGWSEETDFAGKKVIQSADGTEGGEGTGLAC